MQVLPTDIYINNGTIWLSQDCIMRVCNISYNYLGKVRTAYKKEIRDSWSDRSILPDTGKSWRWAKVNGNYYYAYNNIPEKHPTNYRSLLPKPEELAVIAVSAPSQEDCFENHFKQALKEDYKKYLHLYNECTPAQQSNISRYAALLQAAVEYIATNNINTSKNAFFDRLAAWAKANLVPYAPTTGRILKEKILEVQTGADISQIAHLPRTGNQNASREFSDEEIRSWVLQMKHTGRNYTDTYIIKKVREMCRLTGKPIPSQRWIGTNVTEQHNVRYLSAEHNFGEGSRFAKGYSGYQRFKNALHAGDCWQVDGTRVNILPHKGEKQVVDKKTGEVKTVKAMLYLYIVSVRDVHSGDILGYTYTYNEDRWAIHEALKMAVKEAGYLPYQIIFDKFPGYNTPEGQAYLTELEHMGVEVTVSSSKRVKQHLERWFGTMQTVFLQESKYYYGEGVKSSNRYAHRSEAYMSRMAKEANREGFDFLDAARHYDSIIEAYRSTPYKEWSRKHSHIDASPRELHEMSEKPDVRILEEQDYFFLFGLRPKKPIKFRGQGLIELTIRGVDFTYRCTDYNIVSQYKEVMIAYDLEDLSHIHIYKPSDNIIKQYLGRVEAEEQAQIYGSKPTWGVMATNKAKIVKLEQQQQEERQNVMAVGSDIVSLLNPMSVHKHDKEENESQYLNEKFGVKQTPFNGDLDIDITETY